MLQENPRQDTFHLLFRKIQSHILEYCLQSGNVSFYLYDSANAITRQEGEKSSNQKITREVFLSLKPYRFRLGKAYFFAKIFVPYLTTAYGQPEKSLISCGFARLDLFTSTCFCLSWCARSSVFSGVNGFWLRSILNPPQRKLIEQKTE